MAETLLGIYVNPPIAIARLGGSSTPQDAYRWVQSPNPRADGETAVEPDWSLSVLPDGSIQPYLPTSIRFRDGPLIRPVCPFFEIRALLGEPGSEPDLWKSAPLTPNLLAAHGSSLSRLTLTVNAQNHKAARRTGNPSMQFGTFPPASLRGNQQDTVPLEGVSPPEVKSKLIPPGRSIPMGSMQMLKSVSQAAPESVPWAGKVDVEVLRFRFTPAKGLVYGPPASAKPLPTPGRHGKLAPVEKANAFLNPRAAWVGATVNTLTQPDDTYDGADVGDHRAFGVVDDTCEVRIRVDLQVGQRMLSAACNVFCRATAFCA